MLPADLLFALSPFLDGREVLLCNTLRIARVPWEPWVKNILTVEPSHESADRYLWLRFSHYLKRRELHDHLIRSARCPRYLTTTCCGGPPLVEAFLVTWFALPLCEKCCGVLNPSQEIRILAQHGQDRVIRLGAFPEEDLRSVLEAFLIKQDFSALDCLWKAEKQRLALYIPDMYQLVMLKRGGRGCITKTLKWLSTTGISGSIGGWSLSEPQMLKLRHNMVRCRRCKTPWVIGNGDKEWSCCVKRVKK